MSKTAIGTAFVVDLKHYGIEPVRVFEKKTSDSGVTEYLIRGKWDKKSRWEHSLFVRETLDEAKAMLVSNLKCRIDTIERYWFDEENFILVEPW